MKTITNSIQNDQEKYQRGNTFSPEFCKTEIPQLIKIKRGSAFMQRDPPGQGHDGHGSTR